MTVGRIVVFTRTTGYRHDSIPDAVAALGELAGELGLAVRHTEEPAVLAQELAADGCVAAVFASTSGDVLDPAARRTLEAYVRGGGGFLALHSAAGTERGWPWFGELLGGVRFTRHPDPQPGTVLVEDRSHPATAALPTSWSWTDEWYDFTADPRAGVRVLASIDEHCYEGGEMGLVDHPLVWCHRVGAGRCLVTALGHFPQAYREPVFRTHLRGALEWTAGGPSTPAN
ncbi:ThuA domain-containing protein [Peterkaempfera sp. SMS 1(5)a]|uniref:ThuA domain-containing protein n=1 Tax=Peterkaempfera podocarpi TaxID=3232308 RepID=UPI00366F64B5